MTKGCRVEGCRRKHLARGYCTLHYQRWYKYGDPRKTATIKTCTLGDCSNKHHSRGLCDMHYARLLRHGDVTVVKQRGPDLKPRKNASKERGYSK